jgi:hypothetical protein
MSHFYAGLRERISSEATQKPGSSNREFPSLRFSEPERFHKAIAVLPFALAQCANSMWTSERIIKSFVKP